MSDEESNTRRMVALGESLLEQQFSSKTATETGDPFSDSIYVQTTQLSSLLKQLRIYDTEDVTLSDSDKRNIQKKLDRIIDDLECSDKGPATEMGAGASICEAYRVVCFALLVLQKNSSPVNIPSDAFQSQAPNQGTKELLEYLRDEFGIYESSPTAILNELKTKRKADLKSRSDSSDDFWKRQLASKDDKITKLRKQLEEIEVSNSTSLYTSDQSSFERQVADMKEQNRQYQLELEILRQEKEELAAELKENVRITEEFAKRFHEMQAQVESSDCHVDLNNARYFVMETDLQAMSMRCKELQGEREKAKEKLKHMTKTVKELEAANKEKDGEIERLKMENERAMIHNDELQSIIDATPKTQEVVIDRAGKEVEKLNQALGDVAQQMEQVTEELATESHYKTQLFMLVQKQASALSAAEEELKRAKCDIEKERTEKNSIILAQERLEKQMKSVKCDHSDVVRDLEKIVTDKLDSCDVKNTILDILAAKEMSTSKKCTSILNVVLDRLLTLKQQNKTAVANVELQEQNERLMTYMSNITHFMDQLANSKDVQNWLIDAGYEDDYRTLLMAQCGRIDSFLKQNQLVVDTQPLCLTFTEFPALLKEKIHEIPTEDRELVLLVQIVCLANEVMRKFGNHLVEQVQHLTSDVSQLKHELMKTNEDIQEQIEDATHTMEKELEQQKEENEHTRLVLQKLYQTLKGMKGNDSIEKCIGILTGEVSLDDSDDSVEAEPTVDEKTTAVEQVSVLKLKLQKRKQDLKKVGIELVRMEKEIKDLRNSLKERNAQNDSLATKLANLEDENMDLRRTIEQQMEEIDNNKEETKASLEALANEYEGRIRQIRVQAEDERKKYEAAVIEAENEKKNIRREMRDELRKAQNECELQTQRTEELRNHFEPILADLRNKVKEAREGESQAQAEVQKLEAQVKEMKADLSTSRIDMKMLQMKLAASEEKMKRERSLLDTQIRMKIMGAETEHQAALEEQRAEFESKHHRFLVSVCEKFKDFVDFAAPISEESVQAVLDNVSHSFQELEERTETFEQCQTEITNIKRILGLGESEVSLIPAVTVLTKEVEEYQKSKQKIEDEQKEATALLKQAQTVSNSEKAARDWEQWAKRVHSLITDNFSIAKTPKELQNALEEAIMGCFGQRQTKRRLEILRIEKGFFTSGLVKPHTQTTTKRQPTFRTMICVAATIHKLQKISGHLPCCLSQPRRDGERTDLSPVKTKRFPIINVA